MVVAGGGGVSSMLITELSNIRIRIKRYIVVCYA